MKFIWFCLLHIFSLSLIYSHSHCLNSGSCHLLAGPFQDPYYSSSCILFTNFSMQQHLQNSNWNITLSCSNCKSQNTQLLLGSKLNTFHAIDHISFFSLLLPTYSSSGAIWNSFYCTGLSQTSELVHGMCPEFPFPVCTAGDVCQED